MTDVVELSNVPVEVRKLPVHTSDRIAYKRCRRSWNYSSKLRMNLAPLAIQAPLDLGTGVHKGLETYYDPKTWSWTKKDDPRREVLLHSCISAFKDSMRAAKSRYNAVKDFTEEQDQEFVELVALGIGMLWNYFDYALTVDKFTPIHVEVGFEVPIPNLPSSIVPVGTEAVYRGRIDLLVRDQWGEYWIVDHKTTARWTSTDFLELDEQCGSYAWALQEILGIRIAGVIYNELYKAVPAPPEKLSRQYKGRWFSTNKTAPTTYGLYYKTLIDEYGAIPAIYEEHLEYLQSVPVDFFRRTAIHRSPKELSNLGKQIALEAAEMLDPNISIYPNPSRYGCSFCAFRTPCIAQNDGSDVEYILKDNYTQSTHH